MDKEGEWYKAQVLRNHSTGIRVHFHGWSVKHDKTIMWVDVKAKVKAGESPYMCIPETARRMMAASAPGQCILKHHPLLRWVGMIARERE